MRKTILSLTLVLPLFLTLMARAADITDKIDWPKFLARQDMLWDRVPPAWTSGAFLGNGQLGAMIFAADNNANALRWHIGRSDVVANDVRIPIGDLLLKPVGKIQNLDMRLDLWNAEATGKLTTSAGEIRFRSFTHAVEMVQIIEIQPTDGEKNCTFDWIPGLAVNPRDVATHTETPANEKNPQPQRQNDGNDHVSIQPLRGGGGHATFWREIPHDDGSRLLILSVGYSAREDTALAEAKAAVAKAADEGIDALVKSHQDWWHNYFPEGFVSIPDARMESFYWIQMYKLASGTRADRPALDLMGPWFNKTPWPKIWWNLNIQLTYWPVLTGNRLELGESLCRMIDRGREQLAKNAGQYSADSYAIGRSCSYDLARPVGEELCDLPWALHNYYLQYRYTMDESMLRDRLYPVLKGSINYYLHLLKQGPDGKLHLPRGYSPEYPNQPTPNPDCNIDLALIRWGCQTLIDSAKLLNIDDPQVPVWKNTLANLTPYPVDKDGLRVSAGMPFEISHRHYSHMLMVYPLYIMNWDQPENRDLIKTSLGHFQSLSSAWRGFSYSGAASINAMMGRGDQAAKLLNQWFEAKKFNLQPNTMYVEAGPVIETPLSAAASIHDMLLTSWGGKIRVFPGVPTTWRDVTIHNLRAEGAFLVTAVRKDGKTQFIQIQSLAGEPCRVVSDLADPVADGKVATKTLDNGVLEVDLKTGETVVLHSRGESLEFSFGAVETQQGPNNYFGVHKEQAAASAN